MPTYKVPYTGENYRHIVLETDLKKLVCHDTVIHHRALRPLGHTIAMGIQ